MLQRKFRLLLTISYYHMLSYGLMPTLLRISEGQVHTDRASNGYFIYSSCVAGLTLSGLMYLTPTRVSSDYVEKNIVIKWTITLKLFLRFMAIVSWYGIVWLQRQRLTQLYKDFLLHWHTNWTFLQRLAGTEALRQLQLELGKLLQWHLIINYGLVCCTTVLQFQLGPTNLVTQLIGFALLVIFVATRIGFVSMLLLLVHQFKAVQLALQKLSKQMHRSRSKKHLRRIADIHTECRSLARRAFSLYNLVSAGSFVNLFVLNLSILFHAVQFRNHTIKSDYLGVFSGECLTILNLYLTILNLNMVHYAVNSCNSTEQLMRDFGDEQQLSAEYQMELEIFIARLRSNRLVFKVCGCVKIDRPACLRYLVSVLVNVIIMVQFDMQLRQERGLINN